MDKNENNTFQKDQEIRLSYLKLSNQKIDEHVKSCFDPSFKDDLSEEQRLVIDYLFFSLNYFNDPQKYLWPNRLSRFFTKIENHIRVFPNYIDVPDIDISNIDEVKRELSKYDKLDCYKCKKETIQRYEGSSSYHDGSRTRKWCCMTCNHINSRTGVDQWEMI